MQTSKTILAAMTGALCLLGPGMASADDGYAPGTTPLAIDFGFTAGGDKLATKTHDIGGTDTLYAGDGVFFDIGVQHNFADTDWSGKITAGVDLGLLGASDSDSVFIRNPLDILAVYNRGNHHIGFGLTEHFGPRLDMRGNGPNVNFSNATGFILQYQYRFFGVRYTGIDYKLSSPCTGSCSITGSNSVNGSSLGIFFDFVF